eukprot:4891593-Pyramimonas_sp.AAC.1
MRRLLVDKDFWVERAGGAARTDEVSPAGAEQCSWVPDLQPMDWQEEAPPHLAFDPAMEDVWTHWRDKGRPLSSLHPLLDGASDDTKRAIQDYAAAHEAKAAQTWVEAKPPAQLAGAPPQA